MLRNHDDDLELRVALAESLGWYIHAIRKAEIIQTCKEVANDPRVDARLRNELLKTANRLETYMRQED
jgi:hypothetical protein